MIDIGSLADQLLAEGYPVESLASSQGVVSARYVGEVSEDVKTAVTNRIAALVASYSTPTEAAVRQALANATNAQLLALLREIAVSFIMNRPKLLAKVT